MNKLYYKRIIDEIGRTFEKIPDTLTKELEDNILGKKNIFIIGRGRTGFIMNCFAIRLMQMGFSIHVPGEPTAPSIRSGDLLIIGSGSGETESLVVLAGKAKKTGATVSLITMNELSSVGKLSDTVLVIPAAGSKTDEKAFSSSFQPMCNLFEQSLMIFLDSLAIDIMDRKNINIKTLYERHANLE
jgi:6-phospho-3-hexuloisomerase